LERIARFRLRVVQFSERFLPPFISRWISRDLCEGSQSMSHGGDHEYSLAYAGIAFEKMKALRHVATPHNYEIWYNYASASNQSLNQSINDLLAGRGTLSQNDLDELYEKFFSPARATDKIDACGTQMIGEIDHLMTLIDGTLDSTSRHGENLVDVADTIEDATDLQVLRGLIGRLVKTTKDIERVNQKFEIHLKESKHEIHQLQEHLEAVRTEILTDPLTSLSNRKHFEQAIIKAVGEAHSKAAPLSLMLTDVDHFKQFNDTFGHLTGDHVLRLVASSVKQNVKGQDLAARYGGEEFAIILPQTGLLQATTVAEHIRCAVMGRELMKRSTRESLGRVTISVGVAALHPEDTVQSLIERADNCLYAAKRHGRNRVVCETDPEYSPPQTQVA
jgi:diguanylate cyclase